jgi:hypothetical protein
MSNRSADPFEIVTVINKLHRKRRVDWVIGYPSYSLQGIVVTTRYNPAVGRSLQHVKVQSDLPQANGIWKIVTLAHTLEAELPNGAWQTPFEAVPLNLEAPQPRATVP